MERDTNKTSQTPEVRIKGLLSPKGVKVSKKEVAEELASKGYGVSRGKEFLLAFYEALYLLDKGLLEVLHAREKLGFENLLSRYREIDENAWVKYLTYRDLRSRGYVVREGFGLGVDFRVYERGEYSKDTAKLLVLSIQEGKPVSLQDLARALRQCQSLKKELVLAVMNRRGEIVYYTISQLTFD